MTRVESYILIQEIVLSFVLLSTTAWLPPMSQRLHVGTRRRLICFVMDEKPNKKEFVVIGNDTKELRTINDTWISDSVNGTSTDTDDDFDNAICRVVAESDGKIPISKSVFPSKLFRSPYILEKMDAIYHAMAHAETSSLKYMERRGNLMEEEMIGLFDEEEEKEMVEVLRTSLEDAGFELLTRRDLDLCEALNAGYLLRLSIMPDVSKLDPNTARKFYPERFSENGTILGEEFLFDGRVLVFRRGYSSEVTRGRLLLRKLDYLQAGLVQTASAFVTKRLGHLERVFLAAVTQLARTVQRAVRSLLADILVAIPSNRVKTYLRPKLGFDKMSRDEEDSTVGTEATENGENVLFKLARYGGSNIRFVGSPNPSDALTPFLICEVNDGVLQPEPDANDKYIGRSNVNITSETALERKVNHDIYENLNEGALMCQYDNKITGGPVPAAQLLKRISISNVVDLFSKMGRSQLFKKFFETSQLVEPTYEEVVVVWRDLAEKPKQQRGLVPPKMVYDVAEIFAVDDRLPEKASPPPDPAPLPLEIRAFDDVPMANLQAVLPITRLIFRPADAFVFDLVSVLSLVAVLGSQKFDNPKLDVLAIVSVTLWTFRTFFRYSNKLARYDLLVKKFLTSKIAHKGPGALKYITNEAGSQRAARAALVHSWLLRRKALSKLLGTSPDSSGILMRPQIIREGNFGANELLRCDRNVDIDVDAALNDLEDLNLVAFSEDGEKVLHVCEEDEVVGALKATWGNVFDGNLSLQRLMGRRIRRGLRNPDD